MNKKFTSIAAPRRLKDKKLDKDKNQSDAT